MGSEGSAGSGCDGGGCIAGTLRALRLRAVPMLPLLRLATMSIRLFASVAWSRLPLRERAPEPMDWRCHASPALRTGLLTAFIGDTLSVKLERRRLRRGAGLGDTGVGAALPAATGVVSMPRSSSERSRSLWVGVVGVQG